MALHSVRRAAHRIHRVAQTAANSAAAAAMGASAVGGLMAARELYDKTRPMLQHSRPGLVRNVDAGLAAYDAIRHAVGR